MYLVPVPVPATRTVPYRSLVSGRLGNRLSLSLSSSLLEKTRSISTCTNSTVQLPEPPLQYSTTAASRSVYSSMLHLTLTLISRYPVPPSLQYSSVRVQRPRPRYHTLSPMAPRHHRTPPTPPPSAILSSPPNQSFPLHHSSSLSCTPQSQALCTPQSGVLYSAVVVCKLTDRDLPWSWTGSAKLIPYRPSLSILLIVVDIYPCTVGIVQGTHTHKRRP